LKREQVFGEKLIMLNVNLSDYFLSFYQTNTTKHYLFVDHACITDVSVLQQIVQHLQKYNNDK